MAKITKVQRLAARIFWKVIEVTPIHPDNSEDGMLSRQEEPETVLGNVLQEMRRLPDGLNQSHRQQIFSIALKLIASRQSPDCLLYKRLLEFAESPKYLVMTIQNL